MEKVREKNKQKMSRFLYISEAIVDRIIPYILILLLLIILGEIFYPAKFERYDFLINIFDLFIVFVFALDLSFKYRRMKMLHQHGFIRKYWIDIMAVFPFYLVFRIVEEGAIITRFTESEKMELLVRDAIKLEREGTELISKIEKSGNISRTGLINRLFKPALRIPRFLKVIHFFEKPVNITNNKQQ